MKHKLKAIVKGAALGALLIAADSLLSRFNRNSPTITGLGEALGLSDAQIDALFILANSLEV